MQTLEIVDEILHAIILTSFVVQYDGTKNVTASHILDRTYLKIGLLLNGKYGATN